MWRSREVIPIVLILLIPLPLIIISKLPHPHLRVYSTSESIVPKKLLPVSLWHAKRPIFTQMRGEYDKRMYPLIDGSANCKVEYIFDYSEESVTLNVDFDSDYCYETGEATIYANNILHAIIAQLTRHPTIKGSVYDQAIRDEFITQLPDADNQIKEYVQINKP